MIKPTIGRKVWYYDCAADFRNHCQALDASICYVKDDETISVGVVNHVGNFFPAINVPLVQEGGALPAEGPFCVWMPYQQTQAAAAKVPVPKLPDSNTGILVPVVTAQNSTSPAKEPAKEPAK